MKPILDLNEPNLNLDEEAIAILNEELNYNLNLIENNLSYDSFLQQNNYLSFNGQSQEDNNISNQIAIFNESLVSKEVTQINKFSNENQNDILSKTGIHFIKAIVKNKEISLNKKAIFGVSSPLNSSTEIKNKSTNYKSQISFFNKKKEYPKKYPLGKFGRITKENKAKKIEGKHTDNNIDNFKKKVFTHCTKNINEIIKSLSKQYKIKLANPTITPQMGINKNENDLKILSKKTIKDIYLSSKPKRHSKNHAVKMKNDLDTIIQKEEEKPNEEDKKLKIIFNKSLREFLLMFVSDYKYLNHFEDCLKEEILLDEFITIKGEFKNIDPKRIEKIKGKLEDLLEYKKD